MKLPSLYSKTSTGAINIWTISTKGNKIITEWGPTDGKKQVNIVETEGKNIGRSNETTPEEQAELEAQSKWEKQKRLKYYENPNEAVDTLNIKPMRAYTLDNKRLQKLSWPVTVQPKFDGVRCMAYLNEDGSVRLMSRGGKDYTAPHIQTYLRDKLEPGVCLDGELYVHGESLQSIRHLQAEEDSKLKFYVYDITSLPPDETTWKVREEQLVVWFGTYVPTSDRKALKGPVQLTYSAHVTSMEEIKKYHDQFVNDGFEGAMIRTMEGTYKLAGKSTDLLKYKMFQDAEFHVVNWKISKDGVPLFVCIQEEGLEFEVRPTGDVQRRAELLAKADSLIGQLLTVKFQDRSDDNIPRFGVGKSFRSEEDLD